MHNRREGDVPRLWRHNPPPPNHPEDPYAGADWYPQNGRRPRSGSVGEWLSFLSPVQQLGYGCLAVIILSAAMVYCAGLSTFFIRPMLVERAAITPTEMIRPTLMPTPTSQVEPTTFITLPKGTLVATPTQAPIPPRESILVSPPIDIQAKITLTPIASSLVITGSVTNTVTPTRKPNAATAVPNSTIRP